MSEPEPNAPQRNSTHTVHVAAQPPPATRASPDTPWVLITWHAVSLMLAEPTYFTTRDAAETAAPQGRPWTVVNVLHQPWRPPLPTIGEIATRTRKPLQAADPYSSRRRIRWDMPNE
jgi:hypothetical protein